MKKQEKLELMESLKENFIKDFNFDNLNKEEKNIFLDIIFHAIINCDITKNYTSEQSVITYNTAAANIQNFHILKALKENNEKLDTLIELLSKDKV